MKLTGKKVNVILDTVVERSTISKIKEGNYANNATDTKPHLFPSLNPD